MSKPASHTRRIHHAPTPAIVLEKDPLPIIVEFQGDTLTFRHKHSRRRYTLSIAEAFREAVFRTS